MMTKDQLRALAETPLVPEPVQTPHGVVHVPRFTAGQLSDFLDGIDKQRKGVELSRLIVDQFGTRLYGDADAALLERLPASFTVPLARKFNEVNGLTGPKDSAPTGGSPTDSPPTSAATT